MNKILIGAVLCASLTATMAHSQEPKLLGCYKRVLVPPEYHVKKTLIKKAEKKYVERNGRFELLEYPPIYKEDKTMIKGPYYVMREITC